MNLLPRWMWTRSVALWRRDAQHAPDPGDMGTAFGLDASLAPLAEETAAPPSKLGETRAPWHQRLDRRPRR